MTERTIVYRFKNGIYINLTNRCPNLCTFCIKTKWAMQFDGHNLDLAGQEPTAEEILTAVYQELQTPAQEVVFCGFGEPTMRLDVVLAVGRALKKHAKYPQFKIRLNTNGLGNLINRRDIVAELKTAVDMVSVSLNAENETLWKELLRPAPGYENGYQSVLDFIGSCAQSGFEKVTASCVENTAADPKAVRALALSLGADFNDREYLK
ncbi:MAG: TatD family nuclease-associated radical SAM protein [Elusimicrobiaceae bacterium]|nr:TatD family nuclease-associated radical SAM protein [Elusimicrobiaceae bacterium]MBR3899344.1 TatD family nuclease-associated radical SAM protein [Elusimicrobiaceae bacterium]